MTLASRSPRLLVTLAAGLLAGAACGDDPAAAFTPDDFVAPTTPAEIDALYEQLGTCNDSFLTRSLTPRPALVTSTLWNSPATARAGLASWRDRTGWNRLLLANELTFDGVAGELHSPDPACQAVQDLFTPFGNANDPRDQYTHVLLYLDEPAHPYAAYPAGSVEVRRAPARVSLTSYLDVISAVRQVATNGVVSFSDVVEHHLPMYVTCARALEVETGTVMLDDLTRVDPAMCDAGRDVDGDGDLDYRCVSEVGKHVDDNSCRFVVDGSSFKTLDGVSHRAIFGGTLTTRGTGDGLRYAITIDRFSR